MDKNDQRMDDEINLKELIQALWNQKKLIITVTAICVLCTGLYLFFMVKPVYEVSSSMLIKTPSSVSTKYGTYNFVSKNIGDYIDYVYSDEVVSHIVNDYEDVEDKDDYKDAIAIDWDKKDSPNTCSLNVKNGDPQIAKDINKEVLVSFMSGLRIMYKGFALDTFIHDKSISIEILKDSIMRDEAVLEQKKELLREVDPVYSIQKIKVENNRSGSEEGYINTNYFDIQSSYIKAQSNLIEKKEQLKQDERLYKELVEEKALYDDALKNNDEKSILNGKGDVFKNYISVSNPPAIPDVPLARKRLMKLVIGCIAGLCIGVFVALFRWYWKEN